MAFQDILKELGDYPVIAAVRDIEKVDMALLKPVRCIFVLAGDILNIKYPVTHIKKAGKKVFLHLDLLEGISKNSTGLKYVAREIAPDGIITTKSSLINSAKNENLFTIQRVFALDSQAVNTAIREIKKVEPNAVEILPGILPKVIKQFSRSIPLPLIAGGLIENAEEADNAIKAGAWTVSTSKEYLWDGF